MLVLITYDVNTEDAAGKKRLRQIAKQCVNYGPVSYTHLDVYKRQLVYSDPACFAAAVL